MSVDYDVDIDIAGVDWSEPFEQSNPPANDIIPPECLRCLKEKFGHCRFRKLQWKVIASILNDRKDICVVMSTGYGKSLCYQFPSVYTDKISIVVSPLISLMQDQVKALCFNNLKACYLGSAQTDRDTVNKIIDGQYNIVYASPEYITNSNGDYLLDHIKDRVILIAIDEAHCISKWGHDFRNAYRSLSCLRNKCPSVPILALTATATINVRDDIVSSLKLRDPLIVSTGFDRPNLTFIVRNFAGSDIWQQIGKDIEGVRIGSVIVYCITKSKTEHVAAAIQAQGIKCGAYHAGLGHKQRQQIHDDFIHDRISVVVATCAFGMGINKPDVRLVIHYGVARDMETYYQEVGRAGRDGLPAKCILYHREQDWWVHRMIKQNKMNTSQEHFESLMQSMKDYLNTPHCRRRFILEYFNDDSSGLRERRECCDNCNRADDGASTSSKLFDRYQGLDENNQLDVTEDASKLISVLHDMGGKFGLRKAIFILRGSKSMAVPKNYFSHPLFGSLNKKSEKWLQAVSDALICEKMLKKSQLQNCFSYRSIYIVTQKGIDWLNGSPECNPIKIEPGENFLRLLKPKSEIASKLPSPTPKKSINNSIASTSKSNVPNIERQLYKLRSTLASLYDVVPYLVATTKALQQLALLQPVSMDELRQMKLDGFTDDKTERFGPPFLKVIREYKVSIGENSFSPGATSELEFQEGRDGAKIIDCKSDMPIKMELDGEAEQRENVFPVGLPISNKEIMQEPQFTVKLEAETGSEHNRVKVEPSQHDEEVSFDLTSSPESVEIIEPTPPPLIEIDKEEEIKSSTQGSAEAIIPTIPLIVSLLDSDEEQADRPKEEINGTCDENSRCDKWDTEINELDLAQLSERLAPDLNPSASNVELDLLVDAIKKDLPDRLNAGRSRPYRKMSDIFEFEDSSSSEPENGTKTPNLPTKRALPNWMMPSYKKRR